MPRTNESAAQVRSKLLDHIEAGIQPLDARCRFDSGKKPARAVTADATALVIVVVSLHAGQAPALDELRASRQR